ncbi:hypothetical protein ABPG74_020041 [Tetrahymena malaccensis]
MDQGSMQMLCHMLQKLTKLESLQLDLGINPIGEDWILGLSTVLMNNKNLQILNIKFDKMNYDVSVSSLASALENCSNLSNLDLQIRKFDQQICNFYIVKLTQALKKLSNLQKLTLDINFNYVESSIIYDFITVLGSQSNLKILYLYVGYTIVVNNTILCFCSALKHLNNIQYLYFYISDDLDQVQQQKLRHVIYKLKRLTKIFLMI